ncbi:MAG TPA: extracellular solute-binding protein [candidate division Zixibacteria bacterium]|nr:extracellular solute-binding protein [candidate division Zixibacteria bacterium]
MRIHVILWHPGFRLLLLAALALAVRAPASAESLDETYRKALAEGGTLNFYGTLAQINAEKILPAFEKRFPGIKINHIDATADKLAARAIAEARGGRVFADIFQLSLENLVQLYDEKLVLERLPPEAAEYPPNLKGPYWVANNMIFFIGAWNTELVKKGDEPASFDDFADPRWKGKLIAEPRDAEILIGLKHKHNSEEKAVAVLKKIAANGVEFHKGHSQLAELLGAGQAAACFTCYSHHYPRRIKKGAPLGYFLAEGIATVNPTALAQGAPHPKTAWLFARWAASEEGQRVYAAGGRTPAHPKVEPRDRLRPAKIYAVGPDDIKQFSRYEKLWKGIFRLR